MSAPTDDAGPPEPGRATPPAGAPAPSPAFLLLALGRQVRAEVEEALREQSLSLRHLSALGHLGSEPGLSYSELARRADVTAQAMQATLGQLEGRGAVEKRTPAGRGRTAQLHLTELGEQLLAQGRRTVAEADRQLGEDLGPDRTQELTVLLLQLFTAAAGRDGAPRD